MKKPLVLRVAPDKKLETWQVVREGEKEPCAKGLKKGKAMRIATKLVTKKAQRAIVVVHKTRYIIERSIQFSPLRG